MQVHNWREARRHRTEQRTAAATDPSRYAQRSLVAAAPQNAVAPPLIEPAVTNPPGPEGLALPESG
jgi:hypothetical protein